MTEIATLSHETAGDVEIVRVAGEIDASNAAELSELLLAAVSNEVRAVVLDLSDTTYIDSSGVSLIFDAAARVRSRRQELRLVVVPHSFVAEVLAAVEIDQTVAIDSAMSASQSPSGWTASPHPAATNIAPDQPRIRPRGGGRSGAVATARGSSPRIAVHPDPVHRAVIETAGPLGVLTMTA
jgi:anti-anti-sigma factor